MAESGLKSSLAATVRRAGKAEKLVTLLLLFILLTSATASVSAVLTGPNWAYLWESLLFGLLIGWVLAIFHWPAWRAAVLVIILGVCFSLLFAGGLNEKILAVFDEFTNLAGNFITTLKIKTLDLSPLGSAFTQMVAASNVVLGRVSTWLEDLVRGQANFDPVAAGIIWSFAVWLVAAWAGWVVEATKNALVAALPALLLSLSTLSYAQNVSATIYLLLGLTLVLIAIVQYDHREQVWIETRVAYPARKAREVGNVSLVITIFLVVVAAIISSVSIQRLIHGTSQVKGDTSQGESGLAKSLGIVPAATSTPDSFYNIRSPGLPRELLIGSGPELSGELVMSVKVNDLASLVQGGQLAPLYWRSFTYDIYTGHGWNSSATRQKQYQPDQLILTGELPEHVLINEQVSLVPGAEGTIYAAGEPVSAGVPSNAAWRSSDDLFGLLATNNAYSIQSLVPVVGEPLLRQVGQDYPGWVTQRYLAVPSSVPGRVRELAIQLTASEPTPYDRARAIEQYLRNTYPYTLDVPRPPATQDLVDYFLFDLRKGYCDYYASAMVILARSAGIPARLAIGYASGLYNLNTRRFVVTQADAHSWAELYFPGVGWVPFEPTAGLPAINRSGKPTQPAAPLPTPPGITPSNTASFTIGRYTGLIILALLVVLGFAIILWDELNLRRRDPNHQAREIYRRIKRYALLLGVVMESGDTPYELSDRLCAAISEVSGRGWIPAAVLNTTEQIQAIIRAVVRLSYQPAASMPTASPQIASQWRSLRWRLRLVWIVKSWMTMLRIFRTSSSTSSEEKPASPG